MFLLLIYYYIHIVVMVVLMHCSCYQSTFSVFLDLLLIYFLYASQVVLWIVIVAQEEEIKWILKGEKPG